MVATLLAELRLPIPPVRLAGCRPPGGSDEEILATYLWNIELASALFPALAALEVALRNSLHQALVAYFVTPIGSIPPACSLRSPAGPTGRIRNDGRSTTPGVPSLPSASRSRPTASWPLGPSAFGRPC